ncbi:hypothetical protein DFS34DRAFT_639357 [Phlyctochytrium arcticum]|nr:hypothetical protein DFS34DRAFT_639357 [Phlyctochytrium arcticum]
MFDVLDLAILGFVAILTTIYIIWFRKPAKLQSSGEGNGPAGSLKNGSAVRGSIPSLAGRKSILEKLQALDHDSQLILFYGSQTGTAEDLATRIAKATTAHFNIPTLICDPEEYDMSELARWPTFENDGKKWLCGFFMATYGEGEPTDNSLDFYDWLMDGKGKGDDEGDDEDDYDPVVEEGGFEGFHYINFALGNRTYEHYNAIGRRLDRRFARLQATRIGERGEGDDDHSMEEDFIAWKETILPEMAKYFDVQDSGGSGRRDQPHVPLFNMVSVQHIPPAQVFKGEYSSNRPRHWKIDSDADESFELVDSGAGERFVEVVKGTVKHDAKHPHYGRIVSSKSLVVDVHDEFAFDNKYALPTAQSNRWLIQDTKVRIERHCLHLDLDVSGSGLTYETGDHVGVWPINDEENLGKLVSAMHLSEKELEDIIRLLPNKDNMASESAKVPFPVPCTVRTALLHYLDLTSTVKQHQLEVIAKYATDETERKALFDLVDNRDLYVALIERSRKDLSDILSLFTSVRIPIAVVLGEILPRISVRYYSISSSSKEQPNSVGVTAVMVRYALTSPHPPHGVKPNEEGTVVIRQGLATSWLQRLHENRSQPTFEASSQSVESISLPKFYLPLYIRTSNFLLPKNPRLPVVMVGPGTGVAPFRAFVRERCHIAATNPTAQVGSTWLFYGCRHPDKDFLYRSEFEALEQRVASGAINLDLQIFKAYSRYEGYKKTYVQHMVAENAAAIWKLIGEMGGYFYVCGDAKHMAHDVQNALTDLAQRYGDMSADAAKAWVKDLKSKNRYLEDVWS